MVTQYGTPRTQMQEGGLAPRPVQRAGSIFGPALQVAAQQAQQNFEKAQSLKLAKTSANAIGEAYRIRAKLNNQMANQEFESYDDYYQQASEQFTQLESTLPGIAAENPELVSRLRGIASATVNNASEVFAQQEIKNFNLEQGQLIAEMGAQASSITQMESDAIDFANYGEEMIGAFKGKSQEELDSIKREFRDEVFLQRIEGLLNSDQFTAKEVSEMSKEYGLSEQGQLQAEQMFQKQVQIEKREQQAESLRIFHRQAFNGELNVEALEAAEFITGAQENSLKALNMRVQAERLEAQRYQNTVQGILDGDIVPSPLDRNMQNAVQDAYNQEIARAGLEESGEIVSHLGNKIRELQVFPDTVMNRVHSIISNRESSVDEVEHAIEMWDMMASQSEEAAAKYTDDWTQYLKVGRSLMGTMPAEEAAKQVKNYRDRFSSDEKGELLELAGSPDVSTAIREALDAEGITNPGMRGDLGRHMKTLVRLGVIDGAFSGSGFNFNKITPFGGETLNKYSPFGRGENPLQTSLETALSNTRHSPSGWSESVANPFRIPQWTKMAPEVVVEGVNDGYLAQAVFEQEMVERGITTADSLFPSPGEDTILAHESLRPPVTGRQVRDVSQGRGVFVTNELNTKDMLRLEPMQDTVNTRTWLVYRTDQFGNTTLVRDEGGDAVKFSWGKDQQERYEDLLEQKQDTLERQAEKAEDNLEETLTQGFSQSGASVGLDSGVLEIGNGNE